MYKIISNFFGLLREYVLPEPFESLSNENLITVLIVWLIVPIIIQKVSYIACGQFYEKGKSSPILGCLGYMFFYMISIIIINLLCIIFKNIVIILMLYVIAILAVVIGIYKLKDIFEILSLKFENDVYTGKEM